MKTFIYRMGRREMFRFLWRDLDDYGVTIRMQRGTYRVNYTWGAREVDHVTTDFQDAKGIAKCLVFAYATHRCRQEHPLPQPEPEDPQLALPFGEDTALP